MKMLVLLLGSVWFATIAQGYVVQWPLSLAELANSSDLIVKATVVLDEPTNEKWLSGKPFFTDKESQLRLVSVIDPGVQDCVYTTGKITSMPPRKYGFKPGDLVRFEHLDRTQEGAMVDIQYDHLEKGRTYLIFMRHLPGAPADVFTQIYFSPHTYYQGVLRCANEAPTRPVGINLIVREELEALAQSPVADDAGYAARQVNQLSARSPDLVAYSPASVPQAGNESFRENEVYRMQGLSDLSREDVVRIMEPLYFRVPAVLADPNPRSRASLARAAAFANLDEYAPTLGTLLSDKEEFVRTAAAVALLSFPTGHQSVNQVVSQHRRDKDVGPFFVIKLDMKPTSPDEIADLLDVVKTADQPPKWSGPIWPPAKAMDILWLFLHRQSDAELKSGKLDDCLDVMGLFPGGVRPAQDMYDFLLARGLNDRAQKYRQQIDQEKGAAFDSNFAAVDKDPDNVSYVWY